MTRARRRRNENGFTLIEVLAATLLMTILLASMATVTSQWLPNWNRGMSRVQGLEKLSLGIDRLTSDLSVAEMTPFSGASKSPVFEGSELAVSFVRTAIGPNTRPGLEIVRFSEQADQDGLALVRERAPFVPSADTPLRFADPVALIRAPFRISFAYAGRDQVWQSSWRNQPVLPQMIRISVRNAATGAVLAVSTATTVHANMPPDCLQARNAMSCLTARLQGDDGSRPASQVDETKL